MAKIELPTVEEVRGRIAELKEEQRTLHALLRLLEGKTFRVPPKAEEPDAAALFNEEP